LRDEGAGTAPGHVEFELPRAEHGRLEAQLARTLKGTLHPSTAGHGQGARDSQMRRLKAWADPSGTE
jgi:hypothetical protein